MDLGSGQHETRKLSFIIGLSPTESYEGGEVIFKVGPEEKAIKIEQGKMITFPSFVLHKVAPVTKGERYVLVDGYEEKLLQLATVISFNYSTAGPRTHKQKE